MHSCRVLLPAAVLHAGLPGRGAAEPREPPRLALQPDQDNSRFWVYGHGPDGPDSPDSPDGLDDAPALPFHFTGLSTFAKLPYANCFTKADVNGARYDIAVLVFKCP